MVHKIRIKQIPGTHRFELRAETPDGVVTEHTADASDVFSLMALEQYDACRLGQMDFFVEWLNRLPKK